MREHRGFTLVDLVIVIAIIGILVTVGYPVYTEQLLKQRRADGRAALQHLMNLQERYYAGNDAYTDDLSNLAGYATKPAISQEGWYSVSADYCTAGGDQCVRLTAVPQNAHGDDICSDFTLTSRGQRGLENQEAGVTADDCW